MSGVVRYEEVAGKHNHNCIDCQRAFGKYDEVIGCDLGHIFHKRCWAGACPTTVCKKRNWDENVALSKITVMLVGVVAFCFIIGKEVHRNW